MNWFGFGFNGFGQIRANEKLTDGESAGDANVTYPISIDIVCRNLEEEPVQICQHNSNVDTQIRTSWSRRAALHSNRLPSRDCNSASLQPAQPETAVKGDGRLCLAGFGVGTPSQRGCGGCVEESRGCQDAHISEGYLALSFTDRVECWNSERNEKKPGWSMVIPDNTGPSLAFPLVPGGYIASNPPFYRPLSPQLLAVSLALGTEHAVLLTASGDIYTWGSGSHGQLGHGDLSPQEEPRAMEALMGMPMSTVAAGGWHSVCTSVWSTAGGDLYVWGWNESGQVGLPSRALRGEQQKSQDTGGASTCEDQEESNDEVFISIQAFPALVDVTKSCEVSKISCGSRHTAAVTSTGDLYTWGWGEYGQLGQGTVNSSDEPRQVEFFKDQGLRVVDVVCGPWNTFVSAIKEDPSLHPDTNILNPL
ncbi:RCC1 domain-containing protein 1 isoform X1 [Salmo salar]|uniref:RCC1 domain-containing protein 1 isoform X1 n=1 Tax=Salmo salar TaxID=8030 RepID=A0A1S3KPQ4_SALSA|nr:RCC1 domain-containing protein 1 isoform X1 [Salmo salar]|eukprot:XP_013980570.1 PREDICTED: RCC1 domain-containing protein 1 isoform X1 [Salmo salar]